MELLYRQRWLPTSECCGCMCRPYESMFVWVTQMLQCAAEMSHSGRLREHIRSTHTHTHPCTATTYMTRLMFNKVFVNLFSFQLFFFPHTHTHKKAPNRYLMNSSFTNVWRRRRRHLNIFLFWLVALRYNSKRKLGQRSQQFAKLANKTLQECGRMCECEPKKRMCVTRARAKAAAPPDHTSGDKILTWPPSVTSNKPTSLCILPFLMLLFYIFFSPPLSPLLSPFFIRKMFYNNASPDPSYPPCRFWFLHPAEGVIWFQFQTCGGLTGAEA